MAKENKEAWVEKLTPKKHRLAMSSKPVMNIILYRNGTGGNFTSTTHYLRKKEYDECWELIREIWNNREVRVKFPKTTDVPRLYMVTISKD